ncbi:hypothetical protein A584_10251 [Pseudomonas syringae pv. theae ICMP 3923]|uniref:Uncharacterized protein n=1 Tax=Pseudomonas syringae pv. theae TaxID=103985 RepID=A0A3M5M7F5_PSESX|nr:hypothetical protein A584_10251 [Pseudomonas syringae pv. theae ICMP 3923]MBL3874074.1 hypothetical protein [Pseudomonas syringae pv. theae]RMT56228.1 hypothetical protein ALP44_102008 [Pseudomonas syringae pv. theae]
MLSLVDDSGFQPRVTVMLFVKVAIFDFVSDQAVKKPLPMLLIAQNPAFSKADARIILNNAIRKIAC